MNNIPKIVAALALSLLISACAEESTDENVSTEAVNTGNRMTISGSVGDGPVIGAMITIKNGKGSVLATSISDEQANYRLTLDIQTADFPLIVEASNGIDLVSGTIPDFTLVSVIPNISSNQANLNPHSTLIVKTASLMPGGLNENSLEQAKAAVLTKLNFGLDTDLVNNPVTTTVDGNNVVTVTHSSEALAEMVRRTSSVIGDGTDENKILDSLAADLTDGALDGIGATGTIPLHTAVAHVVSLQVLLEAMLHDLHVNGVPADEALTAAINTIMETSSKPFLTDGSTKINKLMLIQAKAALAAIQAIDPSITLNDLREVLKELGDEATTEEMITALAQYSLDLSISSSLDDSISGAVSSTEEEIIAINDAANTYNDETQEENTEAVTPIENIIPNINGTPASSVTEDSSYSFTPTASDPDGDTLSFSIVNRPDWASFDATIGTLSGTPGFDTANIYNNIVISVSDGSATVSLSPFSITVINTNQTPLISGAPNLSVSEGASYSFTPSSSDPDGDTLTFSILNQPSWANFSTSTGSLSGTPDFGDADTYNNITISVSDGSATSSLSPFSIIVTIPVSINSAPSISGSPVANIAEGQNYSFTPAANDPDGDALSFRIANRPVWASFDATSGTLSGTPGFDTANNYNNIVISVSDGSATASLSAFSITVTETNQAPTISGSPATNASEGSSYSFTPAANDPDGDALSFRIANRPVWASFDATSGTLSGTPGFDTANNYNNIVISVSDGSATASLSAFSITVTETNQAPTISGSPATNASEGSSYSFTPAANDPDGDTLSFSIVNRPVWAGFNATSGALSGTPGLNDANTYSNIVISVSDGSATTSLSAFSITVTETNQAPTISGTPASSVTVGEQYIFIPVASDPDGDNLTFSIMNLPGWATFDITSGAIAGTPDSTDIALYEDIFITVSDGSAETSLNTISIMVDAAPVTTGSATLSWEIPTTRTDGASLSLSEIDGYRIYMGSTEDNLSMIVDLNEGTATSYTVMDLTVGSYIFSVTTYDTDGNESSFSNLATKAVM